MGRTDIDIDDDLVAEVMRRHGLRTKREAAAAHRVARRGGLIAVLAQRHGATLIHSDADLAALADVLAVRQIDLR